MNDRGMSILGQIGGYSAGFLAWIEQADNLIGLIGTICAATLSVWAVIGKIKKSSKAPKE